MALFRRGNSLGLQTEEKKEEKKDETLPFVTPDQLSTFGTSLRTELSGVINGAVAEIRGAFSTLQGQGQREERREVPITDLTDEEYQEAIQAGDVGKIKVREQAIQERSRREAHAAINAARGEFTPVVESMAAELATTTLASLPYYSLFKKDVDSLLSTIPPAQRNRTVIEHIYHSVCGRPENLSKIREHETNRNKQEETERAMASGTGVQRGRENREKTVTFEGTFGEQLSSPTATLPAHGPLWQGRRRGFDPDSYAKDVGFQGKEDFARFSRAVMAVEDCPECFSPIVGGKCAGYCKMNKLRG